MKRQNPRISWLICLSIVSAMFLCLYHPFILSGSLLAYDDVGGDTIHQYLPLTEYELQAIAAGEDGIYALQSGFGSYQEGFLSEYLFPLQLPILLFGHDLFILAFW